MYATFLGEMIQVYILFHIPHCFPNRFPAKAQETGAMQQTKASGPQSTALVEIFPGTICGAGSPPALKMEVDVVDVSDNRGFSPQIIHGLIGFSIIFTIHFGVKPPISFLKWWPT